MEPAARRSHANRSAQHRTPGGRRARRQPMIGGCDLTVPFGQNTSESGNRCAGAAKDGAAAATIGRAASTATRSFFIRCTSLELFALWVHVVEMLRAWHHALAVACGRQVGVQPTLGCVCHGAATFLQLCSVCRWLPGGSDPGL
jgi:hypothetical protein